MSVFRRKKDKEKNKEEVDSTAGEDDAPSEMQEDRKKLWSRASEFIGKDITSLISLPVSMFEPCSVLQSMCEPLQHVDLIDQICQAEDPFDRLCMVAVFCVALLSSYNRTLKPFNPILGETFEYVAPNKRYKCLCEQVSHHPPIGIAHTSADDWSLQQESKIETKFWGNSVEVFSVGGNHLRLKKRNEHYMWTNPETCIHNILIGRIWLEPRGILPVRNVNTGDSCTINYKKAGWFEGASHEVHGEARDKDGNLKAVITGKYTDSLYLSKVGPNGSKTTPVLVWKKPHPDISNKWKWPPYLYELTATDPEYDSVLPPTDSRLRGDVRALKAGNVKLAGKEKTKIEEAERQKRKDREARAHKWTPIYFSKVNGETEKDSYWEHHGDIYWEERDKRIKERQNAQPDGNNVHAAAEGAQEDANHITTDTTTDTTTGTTTTTTNGSS